MEAIEVPDEETAYEVGLGIIGRAQKLHDDPIDDNEEMAERLKEIGQELIEKYE